MDNFNKNDQINRNKKPFSEKPGVDDFYVKNVYSKIADYPKRKVPYYEDKKRYESIYTTDYIKNLKEENYTKPKDETLKAEIAKLRQSKIIESSQLKLEVTKYKVKIKSMTSEIEKLKNHKTAMDVEIDEKNNEINGLKKEIEFILEEFTDLLFLGNINSMIEKLTEFNDSLKELTQKASEEKTGKIEAIPDIKKNLNTLSSNIKKQLEETIFTKENEFLSSSKKLKKFSSFLDLNNLLI